MKLKVFLISIVAVLHIVSSTAFADEPFAQPEFLYTSQIDLSTSTDTRKARDILFSMAFFNTEGRVIHNAGSLDIDFNHHARKLDLFQYWDTRNADQYKSVITKVAYTINADHFQINQHRLSNIDYLKATIGDYEIKELSTGKFKVSSTIFSPSFTYELQFFTWPDVPLGFQAGIAYTLEEDHHLGQPYLTAVQHNYNYGRVLLHKTTKMSVSITNYYKLGNHQVMVVVYSLSYLHNIPPNFIGGEKFLEQEIKEMIRDFVVRTRQYNETRGNGLSMANPATGYTNK